MGFNKCSAPGCTSKCGQGLIIRGLPKNQELKKHWVQSFPEGVNLTSSSAICELHFDSSQFEKVRSDGKKKLKSNAVPSVWTTQVNTGNENDNGSNNGIRPMRNKNRVLFGNLTNHIDHNYSATSTNFSKKGNGTEKPTPPQQVFINSTLTFMTLMAAKSLTTSPSVLSATTAVSTTETQRSIDKTSVTNPIETLPMSATTTSELKMSSDEVSCLLPHDPDVTLPMSASDASSSGLSADPVETLSTTASTTSELKMSFDEVSCLLPHDPDVTLPMSASASFSGLSADPVETLPTTASTPSELKMSSDGCLHDPDVTLPMSASDASSSGLSADPVETLSTTASTTSESQKSDNVSYGLHPPNVLISLPSAGTSEQDERLAGILEIVARQEEEIKRLRTTNDEKSNMIKLLERKLSTKLGIQQKYNVLKSSYNKLTNLHSACARSLSERFPSLRQDQITALLRKSTKGMKWSAETTRDALVMKMRCGTSGYSHLVKKLPIFPSVRSLQSYVQFVRFKCGILQDILDLMESAVKAFNPFERDCHLTLDELAIEPGERMDFSTKTWVGKATLPSHVGIAKKALVFLLAGVSRRWKQPVAVHLTNCQPQDCNKKDNLTGKAMANIIDEVVISAEKIGLRVNGATSDMGPDNLAWWKVKGIEATRDGPVKCSFPHPARPNEEFYVLPDAPHLFKSTKKMIESNKIIRLPPDIVKQENLPSDIVKYSHIEDLCEFEGKFELKIAPQLKEENLHCKKQFSAMNVSTSRAVVNNRTCAGLKKLSKVKQDPSYLTTAWFVMLLNEFFSIVTSRCQKVALSKHNASAYKKATDHLKKVSYVFRHMRVGVEGHWKGDVVK